MMHCSSRTSPLMTVLIPFCDIVIFDFRAEKNTYAHFCADRDVSQLLKIYSALTYFYSTFACKSAFISVQKYHGKTNGTMALP